MEKDTHTHTQQDISQSKKRILITGGSGLLGRHLYEELKNDYDVLLTDLFEDKNNFSGSVCDLEFLISITKNIDIVIHTAALSSMGKGSESQVFHTNTLGTYNIHEAARINGVSMLISTSSESVYGFFNNSTYKIPEVIPIDEKCKRIPTNEYELSKIIGEDIADFFWKKYGLVTPVIRASWIVKPDDYQSHNGFINGGKDDKEGRGYSAFPLKVFNTHAYIDVRDLAKAYRVVIKECKDHQIFNVCADYSTLNLLSLNNLYKKIVPNINFREDIASGLSNKKIKKLGFTPTYNRMQFRKNESTQ